MKAKKAVVPIKYKTIDDERLRNKILEGAYLEAANLSKYNKREIAIEELEPDKPHKNIYGLLFRNDSNEKCLKVIAKTCIFGVEFAVMYPNLKTLYKVNNNVTLTERTRTQDFLTPLEVCFINELDTRQLLDIVNKQKEEQIEQETDINLF